MLKTINETAHKLKDIPLEYLPPTICHIPKLKGEEIGIITRKQKTKVPKGGVKLKKKANEKGNKIKKSSWGKKH